jgi:hypothetical protein
MIYIYLLLFALFFLFIISEKKMAKLNKDIFYYTFQNLHEIIITTINKKNSNIYKKSLHSYLLINKLWCEVIIPILWSYPYKYVYKNYLLICKIIILLSNAFEVDIEKDKSISKLRK